MAKLNLKTEVKITMKSGSEFQEDCMCRTLEAILVALKTSHEGRHKNNIMNFSFKFSND